MVPVLRSLWLWLRPVLQGGPAPRLVTVGSWAVSQGRKPAQGGQCHLRPQESPARWGHQDNRRRKKKRRRAPQNQRINRLSSSHFPWVFKLHQLSYWLQTFSGVKFPQRGNLVSWNQAGAWVTCVLAARLFHPHTSSESFPPRSFSPPSPGAGCHHFCPPGGERGGGAFCPGSGCTGNLPGEPNAGRGSEPCAGQQGPCVWVPFWL